jgi:hypothetical protein
MNYTQQAVCRFTVASWSEEVYADIDPGEGTTVGGISYPRRGLSRADVGYSYTGDLEASSTLTYLMGYRNGEDLVIGLERVEGSLAGHDGSFVLRHEAVHDAGSVTGTVSVVPGMGTGGLEGLRGEALLEIRGQGDDGYELLLAYDLE